jgi:hypothetical protein
MLKFNQMPPTAETTEVDVRAMRFLAYSVEDRCLNGVAEVCASMVVTNDAEPDEIAAIGEKIGQAIEAAPAYRHQESDAVAFPRRYQEAAEALLALAKV